MKRHAISFLKSPIGYLANLIATLDCYIWVPVPTDVQCWLCETFAIKDGIQDDCMF